MATVTVRLAAFENESVLFTFDYDDVSLNVLAFRCVNNAPLPAYGEIWRTSDGTKVSTTFPAGATTVLPVPTTANQRIQLTVVQTTHGPRLSGYDVRCEYPAA